MRARYAAPAAAVAVLSLLAVPTSASADGSGRPGQGRIVFGAESATGTQLWTIWPNGTHLRQITHVEGDAGAPDWSPDGRSIVYAHGTEDGATIEIMDADGSNVRVLPSSSCVADQPVFTADASRIIYERYDCGTDDSLFSQTVNGTDEQRLTTAAPDGQTDPNVSPDGAHLSFIRMDQGVEYQQALTVANADGSNQRDVVPPSWDIAVKHAWSPDSRRLVFTRDANPDPVTDVLAANVGTISADGGHVTMLTHYAGGRLSAFAGSYSPDGRWIVYRLQNNETGRSGLWIMRTDGSQKHEIFSQDGVRPRYIDWG
jgi:Tol biopolymer transport system component